MQAASEVIEQIAVANSSSVFVYDLAEHVGFGQVSKKLNGESGVANVLSLQTRAGAGLSLVGRLSEDGTSKDTEKDSTLTAYTTPSGLAAMASSFAYLPEPSANGRIVVQVPALTPVGPTLELSPTLAPLSTILGTLPDTFTVLFSSTPQESVDLANASYSITDSHVIHVFDQYGSARELGHTLAKPASQASATNASVLDALKSLSYPFFDYIGDKDASDIIVLLNGPLASMAKAFVNDAGGLGVLTVRVLKPWDAEQFLAAVPSSAKTIHVVDEVSIEGTQGALFMDVFASFLGGKSGKPTVRANRIVPARTQEFVKSPSSFVAFLESIIPRSAGLPEDSDIKKLLFFDTPSSTLAGLPGAISSAFAASKTISSQYLIDYDVFSKPGGVSASRIALSQASRGKEIIPLNARVPLGHQPADTKVDFVAILDQSLIKTHVIDRYLKRGAVLLLFSSWTTSELAANIPASVIDNLRSLDVAIYNVNVKALELDAASASIIGHLVFLRLYLGAAASETTLKSLAHGLYPREDISIDKLNAKAWASLERFSLFAQSPEDTQSAELKPFEFNAVVDELASSESSLPGSHIDSWHQAAHHILFPDAFTSPTGQTEEQYPPNPALRPELPERTFLVTCSVNRRLTPLDYDRNVFHLEFDTKGTGLKYEIGEALGVHGWNDADEVLEFCKWYGADPDRLITIPVPGVEGQLHTRTVFQVLQQQIDLFGKPPKSFYADLSNHATSKNDMLILQFVGSPEGSSMFKKLSEKETVTFADILKEYKSARPSIDVLCQMIGDIKPRHYSIASAQSVVGDRVDLLVVTVEWSTPSGSPRYGQCTRYLADLKVGQKVTVSIKPSVMKLPPSDLQPLILAGLGTGAAPFRAFLQHRALLASQGKPVGPLYYYFGSRYRGKEYLYGEEIEAFMLDKTITKAGLAFSRDGRKKVYIQHKMVEDADDLAKMLYKDEGVFYLCGPTWPVPDVYEALVTALKKTVGWDEKTAGDYLEGLKEEERYVLEVY